MIRGRQKVQKKIIQGFSLIEILVAFCIFFIGVLVIIIFFGIHRESSVSRGNVHLAQILASNQLEYLLGLDFSSSSLELCGDLCGDLYEDERRQFCHSDEGGGREGLARNLNSQGKADLQGRFRREWDIAIVANEDSNHMRQITVRVRWTDKPLASGKSLKKGFNRQVEMKSLKIKPKKRGGFHLRGPLSP